MTGRQVLIVEDNDDIRCLLRVWLEHDDRCYAVWEAVDPSRAVALSRSHPVDAIVLDFSLAGGTAADCLPAMRQARPTARIVVYTANVQAAQAAHLLERGADHLVEKLSTPLGDLTELLLDP